METNNVSPAKKDSILKTLAITGFLATLLIVAWLAIQLVHLFPTAFSSLASLAEGVNQYQETIIDANQEIGTLTMTSNTSLVNNGETVDIEWSKVNANGSYVFSYECTDGVAIAHISAAGARPVDCNTNYNVGDTTTLTLAIDSEKNRYADVAYSIAFLRTSDTEPRATGSDTVTVVNTAINNQFTLDETEGANGAVDTTDEVTTPSVDTPTLQPGTPTYTQEFTYAIPVSDPNGYTDLGASYVGVGEVINRSFVEGPVSRDNDGAIQFIVKNFGTKTSRDWTFTMELPNGTTYNSPTQDALKPNERAVITIGFPSGAPAIHTFTLEINEPTDRNSANDSFSRTVGFAS